MIYFALIAILLSPLPFFVWLRYGKEDDKAGLILKTALTGFFALFVFLAGVWGILSCYLRYLIPAVFLISIPYRELSRLPFVSGMNQRRVVLLGIRSFFLLVFIALDITVLKGCFHEGKAYDLSFPLQNGGYYVLQGGNSPVTNLFHLKNPVQKYALDIVKLDRAGRRAAGIAPKNIDGYFIFGEPVGSPCKGRVIKAVDGIPDNAPPKMNPEEPAGNHLIIDCEGIEVFIAHLKNGSITVEEGDSVRAGDVLGKAGNSGNSLEPHIHIHAMKRDGAGLKPAPITFGSRFLSLNSVLRN
ncbi:MAG: M23 family metallopeptidase [Deltaproteobacteria bacterium]|nr:M23 family metallopeptidase [Deltaproteobacteria bacterium]